jgi:hypothetical protein
MIWINQLRMSSAQSRVAQPGIAGANPPNIIRVSKPTSRNAYKSSVN